jgi:hypothetical protein
VLGESLVDVVRHADGSTVEHLGGLAGEHPVDTLLQHSSLSPVDGESLLCARSDDVPAERARSVVATRLGKLLLLCTGALRSPLGFRRVHAAQDAEDREFGAFAATLGEDELRLEESRELLREKQLRRYRRACPRWTSSKPPQDAGSFVQLSGVVKRSAVKLSKTCQVAARTYRFWKRANRPVAARTVTDAVVIDALLPTRGTPEGL